MQVYTNEYKVYNIGHYQKSGRGLVEYYKLIGQDEYNIYYIVLMCSLMYSTILLKLIEGILQVLFW